MEEIVGTSNSNQQDEEEGQQQGAAEAAAAEAGAAAAAAVVAAAAAAAGATGASASATNVWKQRQQGRMKQQQQDKQPSVDGRAAGWWRSAAAMVPAEEANDCRNCCNGIFVFDALTPFARVSRRKECFVTPPLARLSSCPHCSAVCIAVGRFVSVLIRSFIVLYSGMNGYSVEWLL